MESFSINTFFFYYPYSLRQNLPNRIKIHHLHLQIHLPQMDLAKSQCLLPHHYRVPDCRIAYQTKTRYFPLITSRLLISDRRFLIYCQSTLNLGNLS